MRFRLAPNLSTLDDFERSKRPRRRLFRNKIVLRSSPEKKLNEARRKLSAAKCRSMSLLSCNVRFV